MSEASKTYRYRKSIIIDTPERVRIRYELAGPFHRALALFIDIAVMGGFYLILLLITSLLTLSFSTLQNRENASSGWYIGFVLIIIFIVQWGYFAFFEYKLHGQTIGKMAVGIKVIRTNGLNIDLTASVLRNLVRAVDALPGMYLIAGIFASLDNRGRRLGDVAADTVVIIKPKYIKKNLSTATNFVFPEGFNSQKLAHKLNENQLFILRKFINNRHLVQTTTRQDLAKKLSESIIETIHISPAAQENHELFIERIYAGHDRSNSK